MQPRGVFLLQSDSQIAQLLLASLSGPFDPVEIVRNVRGLREALRRSAPGVAIVDVESISLPDLGALARDFPTISFVCNHRSPDERLWVETMNAGAADCCPSDDVAAILHAVISSASIRSAAA
jgi:DNA-binding NarL/FixJ family response regulator